MFGEIAPMTMLGPVGVMLIGALFSGYLAVKAFRLGEAGGEPDALSGLFERETFEHQVSDPKLRHIRARGLRRTTRANRQSGLRQREKDLNGIAAVLRGSERDPGVVGAATRYLAGEGFIILDHSADTSADKKSARIAEFGEFEEVKLLPAPDASKAA